MGRPAVLPGLGLLGGLYVFLIVALLAADALFTSPGNLWTSLASPDIRSAFIRPIRVHPRPISSALNT